MTSLFFVREVKGGDGKSFFWGGRVRWGWVEQERKNFKKINLFALQKQRGKVGRGEGKQCQWQYKQECTNMSSQTPPPPLVFWEQHKKRETFLPFQSRKKVSNWSREEGRKRLPSPLQNQTFLLNFPSPFRKRLSKSLVCTDAAAPMIFRSFPSLFSGKCACARREVDDKIFTAFPSSSPSSSSHHHAFVREGRKERKRRGYG